METTLRPLSLGEILDRTAELYRSNFLLLAGISSVYGGILLVLSLIQIGAQQGALAMHMKTGLIVVSVIGLVILWLAIFITGGVAIAANTRAVGWVHLGEPASIGTAYRAILPRTGRYLWLMTITYFRAWFPCVLVYGAYAALHPRLYPPHRTAYASCRTACPENADDFPGIECGVSLSAGGLSRVRHHHEPALLAGCACVHCREPEAA